MTRKKKLTDEIDLASLYKMREQGMTNQQIANSLGTCVNTVRKYIGSQNGSVRGHRVPGRKKITQKVLPSRISLLETITSETMDFKGRCRLAAKIDYNSKQLVVTVKENTITMDFDEAFDVVVMLRQISEHIANHNEGEMKNDRESDTPEV